MSDENEFQVVGHLRLRQYQEDFLSKVCLVGSPKQGRSLAISVFFSGKAWWTNQDAVDRRYTHILKEPRPYIFFTKGQIESIMDWPEYERLDADISISPNSK